MRPRLRIGFVTYGLDRPLSGTTRVALELGRALANQDAFDLVYLTTHRTGPFRESPYRSHYLPGCRLLPGFMLFGGPLVAAAARALRLDLVHDPVGVSPFTLGRWAGRFRRVVNVHDAVAFRYPEGYPPLNRFVHRRFVPATLRNVDAVTTVSHDALRDVCRFLEWPAERTFVVPNGVSPHFRPVERQRARMIASRYGLSEPYILSVGSQQARKNIPRLVAAYALVREQFPHHRLAIAGPTQWDYAAVREIVTDRRLHDGVRVLGYVPEADLPALYSAADAFVFPSLYEGFGVPVIEAMACGAPVICSAATSLPEIAGDAAWLVDPLDVPALAEAIAALLGDSHRAESLRQRGFARAAAFTWQRSAEATGQVYQAVAAS